VTSSVWLVGFRGLKHFDGILGLMLLVTALAIFLLGANLLGGRGLLGSLALLVGLLGVFLAALTDRQAEPSFRFGVLVVSPVLILAGADSRHRRLGGGHEGLVGAVFVRGPRPPVVAT
jgi:hypothetical protein